MQEHSLAWEIIEKAKNETRMYYHMLLIENVILAFIIISIIFGGTKKVSINSNDQSTSNYNESGIIICD